MLTMTSENSIPQIAASSFEETRNSMLTQTVFQVGNESYSWDDVFNSAKLGGEWSSLEKRVTNGVACQKKLQFLEEEVDEAELETACDSFRYERDLIAAEDLEAWLEKRGLSVEDWMEFIERKLLLEQWSDDLDEILEQFPVTGEQLEKAMRVDGICSGEFQRFAFNLAAQAALCVSANCLSIEQNEIADFLKSVPVPMRKCCNIEKLVMFKLGADRYKMEEITEEKVLERIQSQSLDYVRFGLKTLTFESEAEAAEALLCIRDDGEAPSSLSAIPGVEFEECSLYSTEFEAGIRDPLIGAQEGDCIGPIKTSDGRFLVVCVDSKDVPSGQDPELKSRAHETLFQSIRNHEVNQWVRWCVTL